MIYGHRERLIRDKLLLPLSEDELCKRKSADPKQLSKYERYEWIVYRADEWFRCVDEALNDYNRCEKAEIIADHLKAHEAHRLVNELCRSDPQQPKSKNGRMLGMYKICTFEEWEAWEKDKTQRELKKEFDFKGDANQQ